MNKSHLVKGKFETRPFAPRLRKQNGNEQDVALYYWGTSGTQDDPDDEEVFALGPGSVSGQFN